MLAKGCQKKSAVATVLEQLESSGEDDLGPTADLLAMAGATESEDWICHLQATVEANLNGVETGIHFPSCLEPVPENWWPVRSQPHDQILNLPS